MLTRIMLTLGLSTILASAALAGEGTFVGGGTDRTSVDAPTQYTGTLIVKNQGDEKCELTEIYRIPSSATEFHIVNQFHWQANGVVTIERNGVAVGSGYYYDLPGGRWANYTVYFDGPLHVSAFFSKKEDSFYRIGDMIGADGKTHYWADKYTKQTK